MKLLKYAPPLALTSSALFGVAGILYAVTHNMLLFVVLASIGTVLVLTALVIAVVAQRRLVLEQAQHIARMRALEGQIATMVQAWRNEK